jgi:hypothetical protein
LLEMMQIWSSKTGCMDMTTCLQWISNILWSFLILIVWHKWLQNWLYGLFPVLIVDCNGIISFKTGCIGIIYVIINNCYDMARMWGHIYARGILVF